MRIITITHRPLIILLAALSACTLTNCSSFGFGYRNSDTLVLRIVDNRVNLSEQQKDRLSFLLKEVRELHSYQELPKYVEFLNQAKVAVAVDFDISASRQLFDELEKLYQTLLIQMINAMSPVAANLSSDQIDKIETRFDKTRKSQQQTAGETADKDPRRTRFDNLASAYQYWFGKLTDEQSNLLMQVAGQLPDNRELQLHYVQHKQQAIVSLLRARPEADRISEFMRSWLIGKTDRTTLHIENADREKQLLTQLTVDMVGGMNSKQRKHLNKVADKWIEEFESLYPDDLKPKHVNR